jgi:hypothetical protein
MKRTLLLAALVLLPALPAAAGDVALLDRVGAGYAALQPGLENYRVTLKTDKFEEMVARMTAGMPPDLPRPTPPQLVKYWSRASGTSLIRGEGGNVFPYMQEMIGRLSAQFAVDLRTLFLPASGAARRAGLLAAARVETSETATEKGPTVAVDIAFAAPTDLGGAFYGEGLELPQNAIRALRFELDPSKPLVRGLTITPAEGPTVTVAVTHLMVEGGWLPERITLTAADGSRDGLFVTTFGEVAGYWLPLRQERALRTQQGSETLTVVFAGYQLNTSLPSDVEKALSGR